MNEVLDSSYEIMKTALITGVRGQDGSFLAEHLLTKGYRVVGTSHVLAGAHQIFPCRQFIEVVRLNLEVTEEVGALVATLQASEIYNLAARSSSAQLFDDALSTAEINGLAATRFLEAIRQVSPHTRFCQASSSEIFAGTDSSPQDENTPFQPINAYGAAKTYAANIVTAYRSRFGLHASTAILFNHESPLRGLDYVTRKITNTAAKIALRQAQELVLGNLESRRDWGFAGDYSHAMWLMLQQPQANDYVIATGVTHSVRDFCAIAFEHLGLDYRHFVRTDPYWERRPESVDLRGDASRARSQLGWQPTTDFSSLVKMMVDADMVQLKSTESS